MQVTGAMATDNRSHLLRESLDQLAKLRGPATTVVAGQSRAPSHHR